MCVWQAVVFFGFWPFFGSFFRHSPLFWPLEAYKLKNCGDLKKTSGDLFSLNITTAFAETWGLWSHFCAAATVLLLNSWTGGVLQREWFAKSLQLRERATNNKKIRAFSDWKRHFSEGGRGQFSSVTALSWSDSDSEGLGGGKRSWVIPNLQSTPGSALMGDSG